MPVLDKAPRAEWWQNLPAGIRDEIDGYVLQGSLMRAVRVVVDIGLVPTASASPALR